MTTCAVLSAVSRLPAQRALDASPQAFVHEAWTVRDGLPVNSINALVQTRDGYIWIATFDGLARFDGARFTVFTTANAPGLPSNRITNLLEARDGTLWLTTESSHLVRLRNGVFTDFDTTRGPNDQGFVLHEARDGAMWVGSGGGLGVIRHDRLVRIAPETITSLVEGIIERRDGSIWVMVYRGGLFRIAGDTATLVDSRPELSEVLIETMYEDSSGALWIGTKKGLWRYRSSAERVLDGAEVVSIGASPTGQLWVLTSQNALRMDGTTLVPVSTREPVASRPVFRPDVLVPDARGRMLFTSGPDVYRDGVRIFSLAPNGSVADRVPMRITAAVLDREGSLWIGTRAGGLHRLKPAPFKVYSEAEGLSNRNVYSVFEDRAGTIWIGTLDGGTNKLEHERITRLSTADEFPSTAVSFLQDRAARLWIGGNNGSGLRVCAPPFARCQRVTGTPIDSRAISAIHEDSAGSFWVGTPYALYRNDGSTWTNLGQPGVRVFWATRDGALWMGTRSRGLVRYDRGRFRQISTTDGLPLDAVRSLYEDADGFLWVGTEGRGLARLDPREWSVDQHGGRIVSYRANDGLFDEVIHQILEDDSGRLWMSSNRGIFWVARAGLNAFADGRASRINSTGYTERDGLRNREANGGSQPAGVKSHDGRLWFPTQDGVAVVDPSDVQRNTIPPPVVIEGVRAGGKSLRNLGTTLALGVDQRDLEIDYTALSFVAPGNVRFRYRLDPYDQTWVEPGNRRTAFYTRVPPGKYTFRVIASNNDGVWNETGAALPLSVAARFYETGLFRIIVLCSFVFVLVGGVVWRGRALRARTRELAHLVDERTGELRQREAQLERQNAQLESQAGQLQELDRAKSHFFANVSHEFRTPLTLILGPLRDFGENRHGRLSDGQRHQVDMMTRNAQRLLRLVNQVLDVAKLESGSLSLNKKPRDFVELVRATTQSFTPLAERRGIRLRFVAGAESLVVQVDTEQMEKVIANLLSNAFKFTDPGGEVDVTVRSEGGDAVLSVRDTGVGIAHEQLPRVFERFYQADSSATRRHEGTGIGLSLVRELVEVHGGTVDAQSELHVGSIFSVRLPLDASAVAEESPVEPAASARTGESPVYASTEQLADDVDRTSVLVVDDNADIRAYVRSVLEPAYRVLEAGDGERGLEIIREALPDLVVADVMMPKLDGFSLARAAKDDPATDSIPIILLTARADAHAEIEGLGTGADDYIGKPFHAGVLQARVGALLANRRRLRERFRAEGFPALETRPEPVAMQSELEVRLREIIERNLLDEDFNPEALADAAGLSYKQLYRRLASELDATPSQLIRTVRVERAAQLLRDGAGTVTEVAYSVGFNSLSHFHRSFRERFGTTPTAAVRSPS